MKSSLGTAAAMAIVAYALTDIVHEAGGHWIATLFYPDVRVLAIATIGLTTHGWFSPWIAIAGTVANVVAGEWR